MLYLIYNHCWFSCCRFITFSHKLFIKTCTVCFTISIFNYYITSIQRHFSIKSIFQNDFHAISMALCVIHAMVSSLNVNHKMCFDLLNHNQVLRFTLDQCEETNICQSSISSWCKMKTHISPKFGCTAHIKRKSLHNWLNWTFFVCKLRFSRHCFVCHVYNWINPFNRLLSMLKRQTMWLNSIIILL